MKCNGRKLTSPYKGWFCCNDGKYKGNDGKIYCAVHLTIANNEPEKFEKAIKAYEKFVDKSDYWYV